MQIVETVRTAARSLLGPQIIELVRRPFRPKLSSVNAYRSRLQEKHGLEIGGPSSIFADSGAVPIYDALGSLDNCLYSTNTIWAGDMQEGKTYLYHPRKQAGTQVICDATDLHFIKNSSYEFVLASHCLEHVANPLRALGEWKRVLKGDGHLLLILPHKDGTFDWRRPVTPVGHMIKDHENAVEEEDLTHLSEILELHDLSKDKAAGTKEQFRQRCQENHVNRAMHQHVFDTMTALLLVDQAGFKITRVDTLKPFHIILLATRPEGKVDNQAFLQTIGGELSRSPFPTDQAYSRD